MLTLGKRQAQIFVDMPSDSVSLRIVSYDKIKFFEYTVTFLVNPLLAYQQNVRSANISIAYKQVSKIFKLFPRNQDTRSAVINEKLKNMTQLRRNFNKTTDEEIMNNIIFSSNLDIFAGVKKITAFRRKQVGFIDLQTANQSGLIPYSRTNYKFRIPLSNVTTNGTVGVNVVVKDQINRAIQRVTFNIDHFLQVKKMNIPSQIPFASSSETFGKQIRINSFVRDDRVKGVSIFARKLSSSLADVNQQKFERIDVQDLSKEDPYKTTLLGRNSVSSYEIRALANLKTGTLLGNIIRVKKRIKQQDTISGLIFCVPNQGKVDVYIKNLDQRYKYVQILRKDTSNTLADWLKVGGVTETDEKGFLFVDENVRGEKNYFYTAQCQDRMGNTKFISTAYAVRTSYYTPGLVFDVSQTTVAQVNDQKRRTFNITLTADQKSNVDSLLENLKAQGIDAYYDAELKKLSGNIDKIVAVSAKRVDVEKNEVTDLGVVSVGSFEDTSADNVVYIFEALYRNQADLFEEIGDNLQSQVPLDPRDALKRGTISSNSLTNRQKLSNLNFTQKFVSKSSLLKGTLSYGGTKSSGQDTSGFLGGRIGTSKTIEFSSGTPSLAVKNYNVLKSYAGKKLLTFDVERSTASENIDLFEILHQDGSRTTKIGECHYNVDAIQHNFLDQVTDRKLTNIVYAIRPIKLDGTPLNVIVTPNLRVM
jgi:hypothetical protein